MRPFKLYFIVVVINTVLIALSQLSNFIDLPFHISEYYGLRIIVGIVVYFEYYLLVAVSKFYRQKNLLSFSVTALIVCKLSYAFLGITHWFNTFFARVVLGYIPLIFFVFTLLQVQAKPVRKLFFALAVSFLALQALAEASAFLNKIPFFANDVYGIFVAAVAVSPHFLIAAILYTCIKSAKEKDVDTKGEDTIFTNEEIELADQI